MNTKRLSLPLIGAMALAGCAGGPASNAGGVVQVNFTSQTTKQLIGYEPVPVTVQTKKDPSRLISRTVDATNVPCQIKGDTFEASFTAPATVQVPDYGRNSAPIAVTCTLNGTTRTATVTAFDATASRAQSQAEAIEAGPGGLLAGIIVGSVVGIDNRGRNDWKYPPILVSFN